MKTVFLIIVFFFNFAFTLANEIKTVEIKGNVRIPKETILVFADLDSFDVMNQNSINEVLKNIYNSNFFENVNIRLDNNKLIISVIERPLIENLYINGIKSNSFREEINNVLQSKIRTSFDKNTLNLDKENITALLKSKGYFFSDIDIQLENLSDNKINLLFNIDLKKKARIKKIVFIGNKSFKNKKLLDVIISEEYRFWKFLSSRKFLNEQIIDFDKNLIKNFYLNNGFYNVNVESTFAKTTSDYNFELIYNINESEKFFFNSFDLNLPSNFNKDNFLPLYKLFDEITGEPYSINIINEINKTIDTIIVEKEFESIAATVKESVDNNKINISFNVVDQEKYSLSKINIYGNYITEENVIRNELLVDEGDIFNEILEAKSINNIKALNIFKSVKSQISTDEINKNKILDIFIEEKPTGEILAGAGFGTEGATFTASVKENNYLGKGIKLNTSLTLSPESIKGIFSVTNPNYKNSDRSISTSIQAQEIDRFTDTGYRTNKVGFSLGSNFEIYDDLFLGINTSSFVEKIETNNLASNKLKKQEGNYFDTYINLDFDFDKRNQKFQTSKGYRSSYSVGLPIISDNNTLKNTYSFSSFHNYFENNITKYSFYASAVNSVTDDEVKLSDRIYLPANKLRGFEFGKVGPKDGDDYVGGNFAVSLNASSTLPLLFNNSQNLDALIFTDIANLWGVDYDSSLDDSNKIRSSVGIGVDWLTVLGPLNFSLATPITKSTNDKTQSFRFNIGTSF